MFCKATSAQTPRPAACGEPVLDVERRESLLAQTHRSLQRSGPRTPAQLFKKLWNYTSSLLLGPVIVLPKVYCLRKLIYEGHSNIHICLFRVNPGAWVGVVELRFYFSLLQCSLAIGDLSEPPVGPLPLCLPCRFRLQLFSDREHTAPSL